MTYDKFRTGLTYQDVAAMTNKGDNMTIETLFGNAIRTAKQSHHVAGAASLLGLSGAQSLCVSCLGERSAGFVGRLPLGGECDRCPYIGHDCLVVQNIEVA